MIDYAAAVGVPELDPEEEIRKKIFGSSLNEDGSLRCVSPSQHKTHTRCKRAWFYDKKMKLPRKKKGKGAQLGTECHERMEKFLKTGVDIRGPLERFGDPMIRPYLDRAPFNGGDMLVEEPLLNPQLVTPGGIRISGFSDVTLPFQHVVAREAGEVIAYSDVINPIVIDHKFKKKLAQYADTAEALAAGDPQAVVYPAWALTKWPEATACEFRHHNHQTEGARLNLPVSITDDRETVFRKWRELGKYIDTEMVATALKTRPEDVEAAGDTDPSVCRAYGGCDFLSICPSAPHNRFMNGLMTGTLSEIPELSNGRNEPPTQGYDLMGLLDEMEQKANAPAPASTPAPAPVQNGALPKVPPLEASECKAKGVYMLPGGPIGQFQGVLEDRALFKDKEGKLMECATTDYVRDLNGDPTTVGLFEKKPKRDNMQVKDVPDTTPAITQASGIVPSDAPKDTNPPKPTAVAAAQPEAKSTPAPEVKAGQGEATTGAAVTETDKPKRGRPPGSKNKATSDQVIVLVNNACPAAEDLMPYVQGMCDALAKKANCADVRLADKGSGLDYGAWKAVLAVTVKTNPPPPGLYTVAQMELSEPVIEALSTVGIVSYGRGK